MTTANQIQAAAIPLASAGQPSTPARPGAEAKLPPPMSASLNACRRQEIPVERLRVDPNNREYPADKLKSLVRSLATFGQLQNIVVCPSTEPDFFDVIAGNGRTLAAPQAGLATLSALVISRPVNRGDWLKIAVTENKIRAALGPIEEATIYESLILMNNCSASALAAELGLDDSTISRARRLLKLPAFFQEKVQDRTVPETCGYLIATVENELDRVQLAQRFLDSPITKERLTREIALLNGRPKSPTAAGVSKPVRRVSLHIQEPGIELAMTGPDGHHLTLETVVNALDAASKKARKLFQEGKDVADLAADFKKPKSRKKTAAAGDGHSATVSPNT